MTATSQRPRFHRGQEIHPEAIGSVYSVLDWYRSSYPDGEFPPLGDVPRKYRRYARGAVNLQRMIRNFNATGFPVYG